MRPIVLVHGAWHGPWCWDPVADWLRDRGHVVEAVTLPGHARPGDHTRIWNRISQYIECVAEAADRHENAVLVGHSMGGYTVQRYLERGELAGVAAVLVASVPWRGTLRPNLRAIRREPGPTVSAALLADYGRMVRTPEQVRELFFTESTPADVVDSTTARLQNESFVAINTMAFRRIRTARISAPITVVAAEADAVFTVAEQQELAAAYRTEALVLPGGHDMMLDEHWADLAAIIRRAAS